MWIWWIEEGAGVARGSLEGRNEEEENNNNILIKIKNK